MENPSINCKCGQKFSEKDFTKHYSNCKDFRSYFRDFDMQFGELLKSYSSEPENMFTIRILLKAYTQVIENKIKAQ